METIDILEAWLDEGVQGPLFVWLHLYDAHMPYAPPGYQASGTAETHEDRRALYRAE